MSGRYKTLKTYHDFPDGERWLRNNAVKYSKDVAKQKRIALERFDAFLFLEGWELEDMDNLILEEYSLWLDDTVGHAHSTLSKRWYAVREYLNTHIDPDLGHLEDEDKYILNWTDKGTQTALERGKKIHWLRLETIPKLIEGASQHPKMALRNKLIVQLLWNTGCRPSELADAEVRQTDIDKRSITIGSSKVSDSNADNFERTVYFSRETRQTMREWLERGGRKSLPFASDSPYLLVGYNTPSIDARQINSVVRQAADAAGIQEETIQRSDGVDINRVTPKALRHSFAVHSVRGMELSGTPPMDLETLRALMGHSSLDTVRHYLQFTDQGRQRTFDQSFPG